VKSKIKFTLKFSWKNFLIFWILFNLIFSLNDFVWNFLVHKSLNFESFFYSFLMQIFSPFNLIPKIKRGFEDVNYLVTFLLVFSFSFFISFLRIERTTKIRQKR
jgi:hypothetical protein